MDPFIFREYLLRVDINKLGSKNKYEYTNNISKGKIHILYAPSEIKKEIEDKLENIKSKIKDNYSVTIDKSISVCFYVSERAFIKGLCKFFTIELSKSMPKANGMEKSMSSIKNVDKIH